MSSIQLPRPASHLSVASRLYPGAWRIADALRLEKGKDGFPDWPTWCFLPMGGWFAIVSEDAGLEQLPVHLIGDVSRLAALGAWRATQGIYRFDPEIFSSLVATPLAGDLPTDVLLRLPEWCVYVETPGLDYFGDPQEGFFAHLEHDANTGRAELRLLLDLSEDLVPLVLHLGNWTIREAVSRMADEAMVQGAAHGIAVDAPGEALPQMTEAATSLVSLVLYLCSDAPEILSRKYPDSRPGNPSPVKTKKGWRLFPPSAPRVWDVGQELGEKIRQGKEEQGDRTRPGQPERQGPRPHIRRAHWHGFWTGPKGDKRFDVRWLAPIPVAMGQDDEEAPR